MLSSDLKNAVKFGGSYQPLLRLYEIAERAVDSGVPFIFEGRIVKRNNFKVFCFKTPLPVKDLPCIKIDLMNLIKEIDESPEDFKYDHPQL